jgi:hypothetical protein
VDDGFHKSRLRRDECNMQAVVNGWKSAFLQTECLPTFSGVLLDSSCSILGIHIEYQIGRYLKVLFSTPEYGRSLLFNSYGEMVDVDAFVVQG